MNLSPPLLSSQNDRLYNIVMESLDATFNVCNNNLDQFTSSKVKGAYMRSKDANKKNCVEKKELRIKNAGKGKMLTRNSYLKYSEINRKVTLFILTFAVFITIFDVFDQIFPSASVLNTGYWIFFVSNHGGSLCVCGRFGIVCRHVRNKNHWIDLQPMVERNGTTVFIPKIYGAVIPTRYEINVNYMSEIFGYLIDVDMDLTYANMCKQRHRVHIQARYGYANQWYAAPYSIKFTPNPIFKEQYGKYFTKLRNNRAMVINKYGHEDLIVTPTTIPPSCLLLISVNVAKYEIPINISAVSMNNETQQSECSSRDVATQTLKYEDPNDNDGLLHEVTAKIWGFPNCEKKISHLEDQMKNTITYTGNSYQEYPIGIIGPEEYDSEFPEFIAEKNKHKGNKRRSIMEKSIPKPICSSSVEISKFMSRPGTFQAKDHMLLPKFEETFLHQELVAPMLEISLKRKRGRPKREKAYSMVTKSENMSSSYDECFFSQTAAYSEKSIESSHFEDVKPDTVDTSFTWFNRIFSNKNEGDFPREIKDVNFELDIIDQLIKEDSEKNLVRSIRGQI